LNKYDRLARIYDARWAFYIRESLRHTLDRIVVQPGDLLVDVGCGTGQLLAATCAQMPAARHVGIDVSMPMLGSARARLPSTVKLIQGSAEALPLESASVDWLVSTSAFHYLCDPFAARREFRRVLRPGGTLVLTDWSADFLTMRLQARWSKATDRAVRHVYSALELQAILVAGGFDVAVDTYKINWYWGLMTARAVKSA
jgi:ubiquinone/menaquinone biosynthesis C-methylase UbiE